MRFTVKCRPLVPLALRRREKRPFGPYSTDRLINLGRRLFMKLHSINAFLMFKNRNFTGKTPVVSAISIYLFDCGPALSAQMGARAG